VSALPARVELKYAVSDAEADAALRLASLFLEPDGDRAERQRITSLYLDSPALDFLRWQRVRRPERFKLRIRTYGEGPAVAWVEVKGRAGGRVHKQRAAIESSAAVALFAGRTAGPLREGSGGPGLAAFCERRHAFGAVPQVALRYERHSLHDPADPAVRVTVDRQARWQRARPGQAALDERAGAWTRLHMPASAVEGGTILELKHGGRPPAWMEPLVRRLEPRRIRFSKYAAAMGGVFAVEGGGR
jgi:hypothetical protein